MAGFVFTPESQAATLEKLAGDPAALRERMESMVGSCLQMVELDARFGAVILRRIKELGLHEVAGWPSWAAFAEHWCPGGEERFDTLIVALEVLEKRGDGRGFTETEARTLLTPAEKGKKGGRGKKAVREPERLSTQTQDRSYNLARLDRDRPDLAARVRSGGLSANAAAVEAGFRKPRSPLADLKAAWKRATPDQRAAFVREFEAELLALLPDDTLPRSEAA